MGKLMKISLVCAMVLLVLTYAILGYSLNKSMDAKIAKIEDMAAAAAKRKDDLAVQSLSLEGIKKNLATELATEKDLAKQRKIAAELAAFNDAQRQKYLQQQEAQRLAEIQKQKELDAAKKAAAAKAAAAAASAQIKATTPPKVTRAS